MVSHLNLRKFTGGIYAYRGVGLSCQARPPMEDRKTDKVDFSSAFFSFKMYNA
jgi:hypothetical protein